jgi:hypothetical protein
MTTSVVALRIGFEFRDDLDSNDRDVVIILRGVTSEGRLGGYRTADGYRRSTEERC